MQIILFNNIIKRIDFWNYFVYNIIDLYLGGFDDEKRRNSKNNKRPKGWKV